MSETKPDPAQPSWVSHLFAILPDPTGTRILMLPSAEGWKLPDVRVEGGIWLTDSDRIAAALRAAHGLEFAFTILRYAALNVNEDERWDRILYVLEPRVPVAHPPLGGQWVDRATLRDLPLVWPDQRAPLSRYLEENEQGAASPRIDPRRPPWARPGWFAPAAAWVEEAIAALGYTQTGPVEQFRNWSISSLLVAPTSAGRVYFKAAADLPLFVNEPALVQTLAALYPGQVPTPLRIDRAKRWMLMEEFGPSLRSQRDADLAPVLHVYGKLQRESASHLGELADAGCIDRRLPVLAAQIDLLLSDPITQTALEPQEFEALVALAPQLKERCTQMAAYNIPSTLIHGDLHTGNVALRNGVYLFFDWTDACIGFPFLDLFEVYFFGQQAAAYARLRDAYLAAWQEFETPARLLEAWELARPLCALHHSISYLSIVTNIEPLVRKELFDGLPDYLHRLLASMRA
jgi:hypothetical protein